MEQQTSTISMRDLFRKLLKEQVGAGIYVWGGNGERLDAMDAPENWIERHESNEKNAERAKNLLKKRRASGTPCIRAFDCSGLVYWALRTLGLVQTDLSSRGFYSITKPIDESELRPGDLVFHHDGTRIVHVGVANGETQIECRGRDVGVVENRRKAGYWNRFGRLPFFPDEPVKKRVYVRGGSVRVRAGGGTDTKCIGIAHRGDSFPLCGTAESGWYRIERNGTEAYITNHPRYTEVRNG